MAWKPERESESERGWHLWRKAKARRGGFAATGEAVRVLPRATIMAWLTTTTSTSTATRRTTSLHKLYTTDVSTRKHTRGGKELLRGCIYEPEEGEQQRERGLLEAVALWRHCSSSPLEARTSTPIKHTFCSVNFCHIHLCADSSHCTKVHGTNK